MEESEFSVDFDGREVIYGFAELDELVLAYATTIHKSQGSEYPAVVIPLTTQHYVMLQRNLVYTGVTRGKRLVVLVGQRKALAIAVKGASAAAVVEAAGMVGSLMAAGDRAGCGRHDGHAEIVTLTLATLRCPSFFKDRTEVRSGPSRAVTVYQVCRAAPLLP